MKNSPTHYKIITEAIQFLDRQRLSQPSLSELSAHIGLSESHLQRVFTEWAGVSPKQFLQFLTKEYAKKTLHELPVLESAMAAGLSGASRLHDLMIKWEGVTPGEYRQMGSGLTINYASALSPFGFCFLAITARGICKLAFFDTAKDEKIIEKELITEWPNAKFQKDEAKIVKQINKLFGSNSANYSWNLFLQGSQFQLKVWEALLKIPDARLVTYQTIANEIDQPKAVRAVATAIARNKIAYLIPCHRVIRQTGEFGQYRWNATRKQALIAWEAGFIPE